MTKFTDTVTDSTPRLEVRYRLIDGRDEYEWGIIPNVPLLSLQGGITRVQIELHSSEAWLDPAYLCPDLKFILAWDEENKRFNWFVHPDIPIDSLIGMLENIKLAIGMSLAARRVAAQQQLILTPGNQQGIILPGRG